MTEFYQKENLMPLRIFLSESQQREHDLKNMSKEEIEARRKEQERQRVASQKVSLSVNF